MTVSPPVDSIMRAERVEALTGFTPSSRDREIRNGLFPPAIKLSPDTKCRAVGWIESEIAAVNAAKIAGAGEDELRRLVAELVAARGRKDGAPCHD